MSADENETGKQNAHTTQTQSDPHSVCERSNNSEWEKKEKERKNKSTL